MALINTARVVDPNTIDNTYQEWHNRFIEQGRVLNCTDILTNQYMLL